MKTDSAQFKKKTMRQVYHIWFLRRVIPILGAEVLLLSIIVSGAQSYVSFQGVTANMMARATSGSYWLSLFATTEWMAAPFALGVGIMGWMIMRDTFKVSRRVTRNFFGTARVI